MPHSELPGVRHTLLPMLGALWLAACASTPAPPPVLSAEARAAADEAVRRGQRLFLYDRLAWVASDIYQEALRRSAVAAPDSVVWAVRPLAEGGHMVSFIINIDEDGGYVDGEVYFDAKVDPDRCLREGAEDPSLCEGIDIARGVRPATADEQRWVQARRTMYADPELRVCTQAAPNFSLLDEDAASWGYVLSASADPAELILSGHTRYRLSADGAQVLERKPLFQRCQVIRADPEQTPEALLVGSPSAELFHEGHVFLLLDQQLPVVVSGHLGAVITLELVDGQVRWRQVR